MCLFTLHPKLSETLERADHSSQAPTNVCSYWVSPAAVVLIIDLASCSCNNYTNDCKSNGAGQVLDKVVSGVRSESDFGESQLLLLSSPLFNSQF